MLLPIVCFIIFTLTMLVSIPFLKSLKPKARAYLILIFGLSGGIGWLSYALIGYMAGQVPDIHRYSSATIQVASDPNAAHFALFLHIALSVIFIGACIYTAVRYYKKG